MTDLHMESINFMRLTEFARGIAERKPSAVLISGDIADGQTLGKHLCFLDDTIKVPIYFILGNHDYYFSGFKKVQHLVDHVCVKFPRLHRLGKGEIIELSNSTGLIGHEGWADGRAGSGVKTTLEINDHELIRDFVGLTKPALFKKLRALGDACARYFREVLPKALAQFQDVIVLMHPPPFAGASHHQGYLSEPFALPHFVCQAAGKALAEVAARHPANRIVVLCGHTHSPLVFNARKNLIVIVGQGNYGEVIPKEFQVPLRRGELF